MGEIHISTFIKCPVEIVFDLSRSIDLHEISTSHTNEKAIAGIMSGLIGDTETVTWQANHLFRSRTFTSKITAFDRPHYFKDEMLSGDFKKFVREHFFEKNENGILMTDKLLLEAPFGWIGKLTTALFLKNYIKALIIQRNKVIKSYAESGEWKKILK